jgi:hypothetical protein
MRPDRNFHGRVFREFKLASARHEMRIDRPACPIRSHRDEANSTCPVCAELAPGHRLDPAAPPPSVLHR